MSDYIPNGPGGLPGGGYDPNNRFEPPDPSGNGPYVLLAILVAVAVIGGVVYFSHGNRGSDRNQQAQAPITTTTPGPAAPGATPALPGNTPAAPAPGGTTGADTGTGVGGTTPASPGPTVK